MLREQKKKLDTDLLIKMEKKRLLQEIQETQRQINGKLINMFQEITIVVTY